jgi:hypothetical protein
LKRITALCDDMEHAQHVVDALLEFGIEQRDMSVLVVGEDHELRGTRVEHRTAVPQGAVAGTATGATIGLALVAVGGVPGLLAAGPVLAALQGLTGGAAAGFLLGTLAGLGWWKSEAEIPPDVLEPGAVLVGVPVSDERVDRALEVIKSAGAEQVYVN